MSKLIITKIKANYFHTWKEIEIDLPAENGVVVIGGEAGSGKTTIACIIRWCLLGEQAQDVDPTPKWASDWKTTTASLLMTQTRFDGSKQIISIERKKQKDSDESILELKVGENPIEVDQKKIITQLKEITNIKLKDSISSWQGSQDKLWWFFGSGLQKQVLEDFQKDCNANSWAVRTGADSLTKRLLVANKEANKNYDASVEWSTEEQTQLDEFNNHIKSEEIIEKRLDEEWQGLENELTDFRKTYPNWKEEDKGEKLTEAFEKMAEATSNIADGKPSFETLRDWFVAGINSALSAKGWDNNIPEQESHEVLEALKVVRSDWTEFDKLPEEVQDTIMKSSKGEGLHCVNPDRGISLGIVNEGNLQSFEQNLRQIQTGIKDLRSATTEKDNEDIGAKGTRLTVTHTQKKKALDDVRSRLAGWRGQAKILRDKKQKQLGLDKSALQRNVIEKLLRITNDAINATSSDIADKRVIRANKILKLMGSKMRIEVVQNEESNLKELYRISSTNHKAPLVSDTGEVNPGHKGVIFSALVAAELANSSLTIPPIWDDSIAVSDEGQILTVISGLHKWAVESERQAFVISNRPDLNQCSKVVTKVIFMTSPDEDFRKRDNNDWR